MCAMHADELMIDAALVTRLIAQQFPRWAELRSSESNRRGPTTRSTVWAPTWRFGCLGSCSSGDVPAEEFRWLPTLAPHLPLAIPEPIALGEPAEGYPCQWLISRWLDGQNATLERIADPTQAAGDLAGFISALQAVDPTGGPAPDGRGGPLAPRDEWTRDSIAALADEIDVDLVTTAWETALEAPEWSDPPVWIHGDLDARNMLVQHGRLSGVLDFATMAVGDPASDVMVAWKMLPAEHRNTFRAALAVDDATWARARGWVLSQALMVLSYYTMETNPTLVLESRRWMREVLTDR